MASTVLVRDVLWQACVLLQDSSPQFVRYTERELVSWLDDAQMAIAKYFPAASSRIDAIRLKPGTRQSIDAIAAADCKPGDGSTAPTFTYGTSLLGLVRNMGSNGTTPGRAIRQTNREILDAQGLWHMVTRAYVGEFIYDPQTPRYFYVVPAVPSTGGDVWVEAIYTAQPTKIPNTGTVGGELYLVGGPSTQKLSIADEHSDDLVNYIVARANMKDCEWADGNKAIAFAKLFTDSINGLVTARTGSNPNLKRLPFAPEPMGAAS